MSFRIFVKPAEGLKIRNPLNQVHLKDEGESVPNNTFWRRRIADGDVILVEKGKSFTASKSTEKKSAPAKKEEIKKDK